MIEYQKVFNLPNWWTGDFEKTKKKFEEEVDKINISEKKRAMILKAGNVATQQHANQERADGSEYVVHPYRVCLSLLLEFEVTSMDLLAAALLHDILEDAKSYESNDMENDFGQNVKEIVDSITRVEGEKRPKKGDSLGDSYYRKIISAGTNSIIIKIADKLDNIRDALNHPRLEKRRIYIRECQTIFLPLVEKLDDPKKEKIKQLFEEAMLNHSCYIDQLLLFNPGLNYWITGDNVHRVKITLSNDFSAVDLAKSIAAAIIDKIDNARVDLLLYAANLPEFLNNPSTKKLWARVREQLRVLIELLSLQITPEWLKPVLHDPAYLLAVIHSRLFMPANWLFPLWQEDYGLHILDANKEFYNILYGGKRAGKWMENLRLVLSSRGALLRFTSGYGSYYARSILSEINKTPTDSPNLLSMRLLSEYLDAETVDNIRQKIDSSKLWQQFNRQVNRRSSKEDDVEITGSRKTLEVCEKMRAPLFRLCRILREHAQIQCVEGHPVWINYNAVEIGKRKTFFRDALKKINKSTTFDDLKSCGIHVQIERLDKVPVLTVEPEKWDALKNRMPEVSDEERAEIGKDNYSAVAIFDTLLKQKLEQKEKNPIWMPRVYRVIDTMADFDPLNVQPITISFQAEEKIKDLKIYLPLPGAYKKTKTYIEMQKKRKTIIARYITATIYNHVVTLGIYSASVDCSTQNKDRAFLCFTNKELEVLIFQLSEKLRYKQQYSSYVEKFNFKKFSIKSALNARKSIKFIDRDIEYGSFLGIDIGGTDTKVSLFCSGDLAFKNNPLLTFRSFEPGLTGIPIPAGKFCKRIIDKVGTYLNSMGNDEFRWEKLDGVGISWPGAVRNSKIVTYSRVLEKLSFDVGEKNVNIKPESSPTEIHSIDLAGVFYQELHKKIKNIPQSFIVSLENDGNSEAYGNFCHLTKSSNHTVGGKLIIKLGTSTAGGYIHPSSALSPLVTEFAKIILDFNIKKEPSSEIQGPVREFVSSIAVRKLSRTFKFKGELVFGNMRCNCCRVAMNDSDFRKTRIEAVEIGKLLNFFVNIQDDRLKNDFLNELVIFDNQYAKVTSEKLIGILAGLLRDDGKMKEELIRYINDRGEEEFNRHYKNDSNISKSADLTWKLGLSRLQLLFQLDSLAGSFVPGQIPRDFDFEIFAEKIIGSVALFSQVGLHISHLVVTLYNIFKKERFNEVILAGGVLRNETGKLVIKQTEAFLDKYYDKIFGPQKHLKPGSVRLAVTVESPDTIAPFGAAMAANRLHKMNSLAVMEKEIDFRVRNLKPGEILSIRDLKEIFKQSRVKREDIQGYLDLLILESKLLQQNADKEVYVKALTTE